MFFPERGTSFCLAHHQRIPSVVAVTLASCCVGLTMKKNTEADSSARPSGILPSVWCNMSGRETHRDFHGVVVDLS